VGLLLVFLTYLRVRGGQKQIQKDINKPVSAHTSTVFVGSKEQTFFTFYNRGKVPRDFSDAIAE
jgi:hypothetical protein